MKNRKRLLSILSFILAVVMVASAIPVTTQAKSSAEIQAEIDELENKKEEANKKLEELQSQLDENLGELEKIVAQKNLIDQEVFLLTEQVTAINAQISAYADLIADKQEEYDTAMENLALLQAQNKERIRAMEKNGKLSYWMVIFKANNFIDLLDRLKMVQELAKADQERMEKIGEAAEAVAEAKTGLESEKVDLEETQAELKVKEADLQKKREEADAVLAELAAKGEEYLALVEAAEADRETLENEILEKEEEYDAAKEKEYQDWLAANPPGGTAGVPNKVDGVEWLVPISYTHFSSPFGYRIHPIYGDWRMHYGVDLSAPQGTPIYASRNGVVNVASYEAGGAGYYVNIDHQDGFTTRYMHMTHYIVSAGQYVYAGQVIGYCGSTGASTGPHLHFSVYYNGTAVNPANYISI